MDIANSALFCLPAQALKENNQLEQLAP